MNEISVKTSKNKFGIKNNCILINANLREYLKLERDQYWSLTFVEDKNQLILIKVKNKIEGLKFFNSDKSFKMFIKPEYIPKSFQLFFSADNKVDYSMEDNKIIILLNARKNVK